MEETKMQEIKETVCRVGKYAYEEVESFVEATKLTLAIEKQKTRLSKVYEAIGEAVVSGTLSQDDGKEKVYKLIDEAKHEKAKLRALYNEKKKLSSASCPDCGKKAKKNSFCSDCGEYVK